MHVEPYYRCTHVYTTRLSAWYKGFFDCQEADATVDCMIPFDLVKLILIAILLLLILTRNMGQSPI